MPFVYTWKYLMFCMIILIDLRKADTMTVEIDIGKLNEYSGEIFYTNHNYILSYWLYWP